MITSHSFSKNLTNSLVDLSAGQSSRLSDHYFLVPKPNEVGRDHCRFSGPSTDFDHDDIIEFKNLSKILKMSCDGKLLTIVYSDEDFNTFEEAFQNRVIQFLSLVSGFSCFYDLLCFFEDDTSKSRVLNRGFLFSLIDLLIQKFCKNFKIFSFLV